MEMTFHLQYNLEVSNYTFLTQTCIINSITVTEGLLTFYKPLL